MGLREGGGHPAKKLGMEKWDLYELEEMGRQNSWKVKKSYLAHRKLLNPTRMLTLDTRLFII